MSGLSLDELPYPPLGFNPGRDTRSNEAIRFESITDSLKWDEKFVKMLAAALPKLTSPDFEQAADLINKLTWAVEDRIPSRTMASSFYKRDVRNRAIGWVWYLFEQYRDAEKATATLIPATTFVPADDLHKVNPGLLMKQLRNEFDRCGVTSVAGFLFVGLDVEFDVNRGCWHFHYHVLGAGDKVDALAGLKKFRRFKHDRRHLFEADMAKYARVEVVRGPFVNEPHPFTYALKTYVNHRPTKIELDGIRQRSKNSYALPTPYYVQWLIWMNRWSISDFTLLSGMTIIKTGLQITSTK